MSSFSVCFLCGVLVISLEKIAFVLCRWFSVFICVLLFCLSSSVLFYFFLSLLADDKRRRESGRRRLLPGRRERNSSQSQEVPQSLLVILSLLPSQLLSVYSVSFFLFLSFSDCLSISLSVSHLLVGAKEEEKEEESLEVRGGGGGR